MKKLFAIVLASLLGFLGVAQAANNNFGSFEECSVAVNKKEASLYTPSVLRGAEKARADAKKGNWKESVLSEGTTAVCVEADVVIPNVARRWVPMDPKTKVWRDGEGKVRALVECGNVIYDARSVTSPAQAGASAGGTVNMTITCRSEGGWTKQVAKAEDCNQTIASGQQQSSGPKPVGQPIVVYFQPQPTQVGYGGGYASPMVPGIMSFFNGFTYAPNKSDSSVRTFAPIVTLPAGGTLGQVVGTRTPR